MTYYKPNPETLRAEITAIAEDPNHGGDFLSDFYGKTLDGSDVAEYLQSIGFIVEGFKDTGHCGLVTLANGVQVSTNGYACRAPRNYAVTVESGDKTETYTVRARTEHDAHSMGWEKFYREVSKDQPKVTRIKAV